MYVQENKFISINQSIIINLIWRQLTMLTGASQYCSVRPNYNI